MKTTILILAAALMAVAAVAAPYSVDHSVTNAATTTNLSAVGTAHQPVNLAIWSVKASADGSTAVVSRVHGSYVSTLWTATFASNVTTASTVLTNAAFFVPGDYIRVVGPTNFVLEVNGVQ